PLRGAGRGRHEGGCAAAGTDGPRRAFRERRGGRRGCPSRRGGKGGGPASHTPAPESSTTVASFRTWRGLRIIVAGDETGDGVPVARRRDVERPARRAGPGEPPGRVACGVYRRGAKRVPSGPGRRQGMADSA